MATTTNANFHTILMIDRVHFLFAHLKLRLRKKWQLFGVEQYAFDPIRQDFEGFVFNCGQTDAFPVAGGEARKVAFFIPE
ncbi:hypothetical protein HDF23_005673 [Mucilaginibacter lappiensis]|uniref:Uncharacterized protein n=1 Tax=Mucilaginibacter lappiensis TaxID=354630 RepID=A0ABR6PV71_9SPHI|nr:hypothetical protein [Mucilaginibacter lappiensis]MBB6112890.1 hypothetical protein [Mucilaginibacter lappiensis]